MKNIFIKMLDMVLPIVLPLIISNAKVMKNTNKVSVTELALEYLADPNCRPELWVKDAINDGDITKDQVKEFLDVVRSIQKG